MKVLVSACLLGENCKYNGKNNRNEAVLRFVEDKEVISICPELLTGLGAPRTPVELFGGRVVDREGKDRDALYRKGVEMALEQIKDMDIDLAILQSRSPTCGVRQIYDGPFTGRKIDGMGIFARELKEQGIPLMDAEECEYESVRHR